MLISGAPKIHTAQMTCAIAATSEIEGLRVSLIGAEDKFGERASRGTTINLGMPAFPDTAVSS
ncbi:hypothetical protein ACIHFD_62965 [Nonomuraea sp. NPDC051941]|uniref:hypothetical protein n=1 Tax=Nonomuraea sp. NPDC051941 TaxID=3364373 RepID=UPI0037C9CED2